MSRSFPAIIRVSDLTAAGLDDRELRRRRARGELVAVGPGCFVLTEQWNAMDRHERYRVIVGARLPRLSRAVIASHDSAAALWRMPCLEKWPSLVHVIDPARSHPLTRGSLARHTDPIRDDEIVTGREFSVTSPLRTAIDMTLRDGFLTGLMLFDHGLRKLLFTADDVSDGLDGRSDARRIRAARRALEYASPKSESPWESISRGQMIVLGFRIPELQKRFIDNNVEVARTDFFWNDVGVAGEFDGDEKYTNPAMTGGRSADQVVIDEKWRSELLLDRPEVARVVRWNATIARQPELLAVRLDRAGVPRRSTRRRRTATPPPFRPDPAP